MALEEHVRHLIEGPGHWNAWRKSAPSIKPDLSGLNLNFRDSKISGLGAELTAELQRFVGNLERRSDRGIVVEQFDFSNTNLTKANFLGHCFRMVKFQGADLSGAFLASCTFEMCDFSPYAIELFFFDNGTYKSKALKTDLEKVCRLKDVSALGCTFRECTLCCADLTAVEFDEATTFDRTEVVGTTISRAVLDSLKDNGGLIPSRLRHMIVVDDVAVLRESFSGIWNKVHIAAMLLFLAPYVWFLVQQWVMASVGEKAVAVDLASVEESSPILYNLGRFIVSGGETWRQWQPRFLPILLFALALVYNGVRARLVIKTAALEHHQAVQGHYPDFRLTGGWKRLLQVYKVLGIIGLLVVAAHTWMFLMKPVPFKMTLPIPSLKSADTMSAISVPATAPAGPRSAGWFPR